MTGLTFKIVYFDHSQPKMVVEATKEDILGSFAGLKTHASAVHVEIWAMKGESVRGSTSIWKDDEPAGLEGWFAEMDEDVTQCTPCRLGAHVQCTYDSKHNGPFDPEQDCECGCEYPLEAETSGSGK
jgi:hypothetical protein